MMSRISLGRLSRRDEEVNGTESLEGGSGTGPDVEGSLLVRRLRQGTRRSIRSSSFIFLCDGFEVAVEGVESMFEGIRMSREC